MEEDRRVEKERRMGVGVVGRGGGLSVRHRRIDTHVSAVYGEEVP